MAKTEQMSHHVQPKSNPFLQQTTTSTMSEAETHMITTSTTASLDEPQPTLSQEEGQQPQEVETQENVPEPIPPIFIIQPQTSYQEELDVETVQQEDIAPSAEDADADSPHKEVKKKKKKEKRLKQDKKPKRAKKILE